MVHGFHHQDLFSLKEHSFFFKLAKNQFGVNEITSADKANQMQMLHQNRAKKTRPLTHAQPNANYGRRQTLVIRLTHFGLINRAELKN